MGRGAGPGAGRAARRGGRSRAPLAERRCQPGVQPARCGRESPSVARQPGREGAAPAPGRSAGGSGAARQQLEAVYLGLWLPPG